VELSVELSVCSSFVEKILQKPLSICHSLIYFGRDLHTPPALCCCVTAAVVLFVCVCSVCHLEVELVRFSCIYLLF
jgi:hypothetical protein